MLKKGGGGVVDRRGGRIVEAFFSRRKLKGERSSHSLSLYIFAFLYSPSYRPLSVASLEPLIIGPVDAVWRVPVPAASLQSNKSKSYLLLTLTYIFEIFILIFDIDILRLLF